MFFLGDQRNSQQRAAYLRNAVSDCARRIQRVASLCHSNRKIPWKRGWCFGFSTLSQGYSSSTDEYTRRLTRGSSRRRRAGYRAASRLYLVSHVSHFIVQPPLETQRLTYTYRWMKVGGRWKDERRGGTMPPSWGWVANEKGDETTVDGVRALRSLGSHTYINVACQAYRATL